MRSSFLPYNHIESISYPREHHDCTFHTSDHVHYPYVYIYYDYDNSTLLHHYTPCVLKSEEHTSLIFKVLYISPGLMGTFNGDRHICFINNVL